MKRTSSACHHCQCKDTHVLLPKLFVCGRSWRKHVHVSRMLHAYISDGYCKRVHEPGGWESWEYSTCCILSFLPKKNALNPAFVGNWSLNSAPPGRKVIFQFKRKGNTATHQASFWDQFENPNWTTSLHPEIVSSTSQKMDWHGEGSCWCFKETIATPCETNSDDQELEERHREPTYLLIGFGTPSFWCHHVFLGQEVRKATCMFWFKEINIFEGPTHGIIKPWSGD